MASENADELREPAPATHGEGGCMDPEVAITGLFPDLEPEAVPIFLDAATRQRYDKGACLCTEGALESTFFVLLAGQVDIVRTSDGESVLLGYLESGSAFGELALLLDQPRFADVVATESVEVLEITRRQFEAVSTAHPAILRAVAKRSLRQILRQQDSHVIEAARIQKLRRESLPEVFACYSRKDQPFTEQLVSRLKRHGIPVWMDIHEIRAGKSWSRQIGEALDRCKLMLFVMSPDSVSSENTGDEWNYFLDMGKPVIPVRHQDTRRPYRLHKLQYIDFVNLDYGSALSQLVAAILALTEAEQEADPSD